MSMAYSSVYGNKIRKLWKLLAKNDMLTSTSYEFLDPRQCKVKDCHFKVSLKPVNKYKFLKKLFCFQAKTAMETFRHIRENHLTEIKQLKIKIGKPPDPEKKIIKRKPGPRSRTRYQVKDDNLQPSIEDPPNVSLQQLAVMDTSDNSLEQSSEENTCNINHETAPQDADGSEEMDFESAMNSIEQLSKTQTEGQQMLLSSSESTVTFKPNF